MKIKRRRIETDLAPLVDAWYEAQGPVLWSADAHVLKGTSE